VAIQAAQSTVLNIHRHLLGLETLPFVYQDRGMMATIGRGRAVAVIGNRAFDGMVAWMIWAIIHIWSLIEFRSRLMVMIQWAWAYVSRQRSARLITGDVSPQPAATAASPYHPEPIESGTRMNVNAPIERNTRNA
jgi:NADH dehydrogenase